MEVTKTELFDPLADTKDIKMFSGNTTGLVDMIDQTLPEFYQRHTEKMFANAWHPLKYPVTDDSKDFKNMSQAESEAFDRCLSHLTNLDSLQVNNLPEISSKIRYPEVKGVLAYHEMEESLHSFSYSYIYNSLYSKEEARRVRDLIKTDPVMRARALQITKAYKSLDDKTVRGQLKVLLTNLVLEAIMFYSIFNFFFSLKYKGTMINTSIIISWIKKNEVTHIDIFAELLLKYKEDYPEYWDEEFIIDFLKQATEDESKYSSYIIGQGILGFNEDSITKYTKHRANKIFRLLKLPFKYTEAENAYLHLERVSNVENVDSSETGIFEAHSANYFDPSVKIKDYKEFANGK